MTEGVRNNSGQQPIEARSANGVARFHRTGPAEAFVELVYETPELQIDLRGRDFAEGIHALCEQDIARMRSVLSGLGQELAAQLDDTGERPAIRRKWKNDEDRIWRDEGNAFRVQPTQVQIRDRVTWSGNASEAGVVREHIRLAIEQREANIRDIYEKVLNEARAQRRGDRSL